MSSPDVKNVSMADRLDILDLLDRGVSSNDVANKYGLSVRTIRRYWQNSSSIREFGADPRHLGMKRKRLPVYTELETKLYNWFVQRKLSGDRLTDTLILKKAKEMAAECESASNFKGSRSWLWNWKKKYNLRLADIEGETDSDEPAADSFVHKISRLLIEESVIHEDLYNMDESSLLWKFLPRRVLTKTDEKTQNTKKDRVTVGFCANATGTHKLPILFVHKFAMPRALKQYSHTLPVTYKNLPNAGINEDIFREWYSNDFKKAVWQRQSLQRRTGKVILIVDNVKGHKLRKDELDDGYFKLICLPPHTSTLIQPMEQGVITECKTLFRHKLLNRALECNGGITNFYANYDIKDCIDLISEAWNEISSKSIFDSWMKVLDRTLLNDTVMAGDHTYDDQTTTEQLIPSNIVKTEIFVHDEPIAQFCDNSIECHKEQIVRQRACSNVNAESCARSDRITEQHSSNIVETKNCVDDGQTDQLLSDKIVKAENCVNDEQTTGQISSNNVKSENHIFSEHISSTNVKIETCINDEQNSGQISSSNVVKTETYINNEEITGQLLSNNIVKMNTCINSKHTTEQITDLPFNVKTENCSNDEQIAGRLGRISGKEVMEWMSVCQEEEISSENKEYDVSPLSPVKNEELDQLLQSLEKLKRIEPKMKESAEAIINYYNKKRKQT
nr:PREDICTED: tigger transposable element-derived protein 2-like [Megachile rotundata]